MTTSKGNSDQQTSDREIVITRLFDAPRELVWQAMTDPERVVKWWGPRGFTTTIHEMDVKPGGIWKYIMHGPAGVDYPNKSVFREVVKPERLTYAHAGGKKDGPSLQFESSWAFAAPETGKTEVTIRMVFSSVADRETVVREFGAIEGGRQTLERLGEQLAKTPFIIERTFAAPIGAVWKALTDISQMKQWYFPQLASFKAEARFETQFNVRVENTDYLHLWKVTESIPERKISYTWKYGGYPGDSLVTFELFPEGAQTRLKLTHEGLETFQPETHPILQRGNFAKGWTQIIGASLRDYLENLPPV